ncbi:MAG: hypothetical protein IJR87_07380 [Bacteroidaceae bacterium]|nr:hypothetical protein [Bacteroidaceae bacterium]
MTEKYHETDPMIDVISDDYRMLQMISRFGIKLGFGDQTVAATCTRAGVDVATFLTVVNYLKDSAHAHLGEMAERINLPALMRYLKNSHSYFIYLPALQPGAYDIRTTYGGKPAKAKEEEYIYATEIKEIDRETHGQWFTRYGRDGYYIVGGADDGGDLQVLPEYVESVTFDYDGAPVESHRSTSITPLSPEAMLPVSAEPDARKAFGCYFSGGCDMTPLEVRLRENRPYQLAVYYADCDRGGRDFLVEAFDLETMNRITPCTRIADLAGGVYVVIEYDRSIRVMASHLRGDNALGNAVFFDPAEE